MIPTTLEEAITEIKEGRDIYVILFLDEIRRWFNLDGLHHPSSRITRELYNLTEITEFFIPFGGHDETEYILKQFQVKNEYLLEALDKLYEVVSKTPVHKSSKSLVEANDMILNGEGVYVRLYGAWYNVHRYPHPVIKLTKKRYNLKDVTRLFESVRFHDKNQIKTLKMYVVTDTFTKVVLNQLYAKSETTNIKTLFPKSGETTIIKTKTLETKIVETKTVENMTLETKFTDTKTVEIKIMDTENTISKSIETSVYKSQLVKSIIFLGICVCVFGLTTKRQLK